MEMNAKISRSGPTANPSGGSLSYEALHGFADPKIPEGLHGKLTSLTRLTE